MVGGCLNGLSKIGNRLGDRQLVECAVNRCGGRVREIGRFDKFRFGGIGQRRKIQTETGALPRRAVGKNVTARLLDDPVGHAQPQACSFAGTFGREKRLENAGKVIDCYTGSLIRHADDYILTRWNGDSIP